MSQRKWFHSRMLAHAAGLLEDSELERFESLLESDRGCADAWQEFIGDEENHGEFHIPAGMVAHWPAAAATLGELERRTVEEHLASCESCAEEVALFGSAERRAIRVEGPRRSTTSPPRPIQWRSAVSGGVVGALAMAAVLLLLIRPAPDSESGGALPWAAPTRVRSDELPAFARVKLPLEATQVGLSLAVPQAIDKFQPAEISVFGPRGALIQRFEAPSGEMGRGALVLLIQSEEPFEPGNHRVLFTQPGVESELWFEVERLGD